MSIPGLPAPKRMGIYESHMQNRQYSSRQKGKRLTGDQVKLLEKSFSSSKKLDQERKLQLACELGVPPRQVAIWYQNRRARWKTQTLEVDYSTLQVKLDSALAEKRELERDVERLRAELRKALDMLALAGLGHQTQEPNNSSGNCNNYVVVSSSCFNDLSGSCGDGGRISTSNSGLSDDHRHHDDHRVSCCREVDENTNLHLDDLYESEMFASGLCRSEYYY